MVQKVSKIGSKDHFKIRRSSRRNTMLSRTIPSRARMKQARRAELALVLDILPLYILHPWVHHLANILSVIPGYGKPHERTRNTQPLVTSGVRNLGLWDQYIRVYYTQHSLDQGAYSTLAGPRFPTAHQGVIQYTHWIKVPTVHSLD